MAPSSTPEGTCAVARLRALVGSVPTFAMSVTIATTLRLGSSRSMLAWHFTQCWAYSCAPRAACARSIAGSTSSGHTGDCSRRRLSSIATSASPSIDDL